MAVIEDYSSFFEGKSSVYVFTNILKYWLILLQATVDGLLSNSRPKCLQFDLQIPP